MSDLGDVPDRDRLAGADLGGAGADLVDRFAAVAGPGLPPQAPRGDQMLANWLCAAAVTVLAVDAVAISVIVDADVCVPVGASDAGAHVAESLQFSVREGPGLDAYVGLSPVLVADIDQGGSPAGAVGGSVWPVWADEMARRTPYRAACAFPLLAGAGALGSLTLYRCSRGPFGDVAAIAAVAAWITEHLLDADRVAVSTAEGEREPRWLQGPAMDRRDQVWAAQGMTMQANHVGPAQALRLLRAHAYSSDRLLDDLAQDIVRGHLAVPLLEAD